LATTHEPVGDVVAMNPLRGIALKVLSVCVFVSMASCVKALADGIPPGEIVFFRSAFALPVVLIWAAAQGKLAGAFTTDNPVGHFWRGLIGTSAMVLGFLALGLLPLPEVVAIGYAAPLLATIFAAMFLGETVRLYRMTAIFLGLAGVFVILYPRLSVLDMAEANKLETVGAFAALLGAVFAALAQVFVRKLVQYERSVTIVIWFSITAASLSLLTLPFGWVLPSPTTAALLVLVGLLGGLGQILMTESYRHADMGVIAPFEYVSMLLAIGIGYVVFAEIPALTTMGGAALIAVAGIVIIIREHRLGLERAKARRTMTPQG